MSVSEQLKILCVKLGISISKLARLSGKSPQAFSQKMILENFTITISNAGYPGGKERDSIDCPWCGAENGTGITSGSEMKKLFQ
ncbi:MAG: hypothetical protein LKE46_00325 [Clostridium sp.]|jgi:hypothetical protein|uniref:hypothetical protein n=1 Tax=Clostridium sp. TaxID=1506 RepID=UPI0025BDD9F4|nr:hypothetical protein [Clostridium sp.]MCH3962713.1 hypothetical protein [Clostridium sp.]MCI1715872.1 hypothetical protein [Clostridium sp.]MCI1799923.1 hypothetical protein [Clostridium sp.]MCI1813837.1 hypothetical protein [Clostridium sp.]MCI1870735.1 hypothetical protein [Clostridium sp.]